MKIALCDDEQPFIDVMSKLVKKELSYLPIDKFDTFTQVHIFANHIREYNLIFLDIDMPGVSGIELAKQCENRNIYIVFVTNKENLVFEAYNTTNAFGFIRKSNLQNDFVSVMKRLDKISQNNHYLSVKSGSDIIKIPFTDIHYIEKQINSVIIHTSNHDYKEFNTLANLEKVLFPCGFIRTHIGYIVNLDYVIKISNTDVEIHNGKRIPVSRHNAKYVKTEFLKRSTAINE